MATQRYYSWLMSNTTHVIAAVVHFTQTPSMKAAVKRSKQQRELNASEIARSVRQSYPDAYIVPGIGWCGPEWESAAALETALRAANNL